MIRPRIAIFGSSLVSAYWNGAATYYRGILRGLHRRGYDIEFYEPDAFERQRHRDIDDPDWAHVTVYAPDPAGVAQALECACRADFLIKASGVGVNDAWLEREIAGLSSPSRVTAFWDVDAPATLARVSADVADPVRDAIPRFDLVLTYGGGAAVVQAYEALGAQSCTPVYNALDPDTHHPARPVERFSADLSFLGNRLPDREARVVEFFLRVASQMRDQHFVLGGSGWDSFAGLTDNVRYVGHVYTHEHNAFNCSARAVLNINRASMAATGFSPPTRIFEAAGAGACLLTDAWDGIEQFLNPETEVLVASDGDDVQALLRGLDCERAARIGAAARRRVLAEHTYEHRAEQLRSLLSGGERWVARCAGA